MQVKAVLRPLSALVHASSDDVDTVACDEFVDYVRRSFARDHELVGKLCGDRAFHALLQHGVQHPDVEVVVTTREVIAETLRATPTSIVSLLRVPAACATCSASAGVPPEALDGCICTAGLGLSVCVKLLQQSPMLAVMLVG